MQIEDYHHRFIKNSIGEYTCVKGLCNDASNRNYLRIFSESKTYILCEDPDLRDNNPLQYPFFIIYNMLLKEKIPVPVVHYINNHDGLYILQDLGDDLIENIYSSLSLEKRRSLYYRLIESIVMIQKIKRDQKIFPFMFSFDIEKLMYEFNFFIDNALIIYFNSRISSTALAELRKEFLMISGLLYKPEYFVLNHRDYHSRNILIKNGEPYIIDFQDARLGLPQYDLVSLLRDSYLLIEEDLFITLKEYYFNLSMEYGIHQMSANEFEYYFDIMAFQRNIKALGTFAYQVTSLGRDRYKMYVKPTLRYLNDYINRREELKRTGIILKENIEVEW